MLGDSSVLMVSLISEDLSLLGPAVPLEDDHQDSSWSVPKTWSIVCHTFDQVLEACQLLGALRFRSSSAAMLRLAL